MCDVLTSVCFPVIQVSIQLFSPTLRVFFFFLLLDILFLLYIGSQSCLHDSAHLCGALQSSQVWSLIITKVKWQVSEWDEREVSYSNFRPQQHRSRGSERVLTYRQRTILGLNFLKSALYSIRSAATFYTCISFTSKLCLFSIDHSPINSGWSWNRAADWGLVSWNTSRALPQHLLYCTSSFPFWLEFRLPPSFEQ